MPKVRLIRAEKPRKGTEWLLVTTRRGLQLRNEEDVAVLNVPAAEAGLRIKFPSFWASVRYLTILDEDGTMFLFEPDKKTVARVQELVAECLGDAGQDAVAALRRHANRSLLIGAGLFVAGVVLTIVSMMTAKPEGEYFIMTGLLGVGLISVVRGIYLHVKAGHLQSQVPPEMDDEDEEDEGPRK